MVLIRSDGISPDGECSLLDRDPRTARIGPKFPNPCWSWSGPRFFSRSRISQSFLVRFGPKFLNFFSALVLNQSISVRGSLLLAIRYNGKIIAVSSEDGSVYFLNNKMVPIANVKMSDDDVTSICFGKEENLFASSTKFVYEIDLKTYKLTGR